MTLIWYQSNPGSIPTGRAFKKADLNKKKLLSRKKPRFRPIKRGAQLAGQC